MKPIQYTPELYHLTFGPHNDGYEIQPEESVQVHVPDCDGLDADGKRLPRERFESSPYSDIMVGNPIAGPFIVAGAKPGDTLVVHIEDIGIDRDFGRTGLSARQVHLPPRLLQTEEDEDYNVKFPREVRRWQIDRDAGIASMGLPNSRKKRVEVELDPFVGALAVAPANGEFIHSLRSGPYGGNMDLPALKIGNSIQLPVFAEGAFLFMADIHAAQGDGEVIGGGIEVGGSITFRVELIKGKKIAFPRIESPDAIAAVGTADNIHAAMEVAYSQLVLCLVQDYGFDRWDAMHLISQTVKASPGNFRSALCSISKKYLS